MSKNNTVPSQVLTADEYVVVNLQDGEQCIIGHSDCGTAEIWKKNNRLFLFLISNFGGAPVFDSDFSPTNIGDLFKRIGELT